MINLLEILISRFLMDLFYSLLLSLFIFAIGFPGFLFSITESREANKKFKFTVLPAHPEFSRKLPNFIRRFGFKIRDYAEILFYLEIFHLYYILLGWNNAKIMPE